MLREPDEDGRYPMSIREAQALNALFGSLNSIRLAEQSMKERAKLIKGGWRDFRLLETIAERLYDEFLCTIPNKKLMAIHAELPRTIVEVKVRGPVGRMDDELTCVPVEAMNHVVDAAVRMNCTFCERTDYRKCQLYRDIEALYHWGFPRTETCPLSDLTEIPEEIRNA